MTAEPGPAPPSDARRLFVGVAVAPTVAEQLAAACASLARRAQAQGVALRWLAPAGYHVTLKFLGWTRPEVIPAVTEAIERAVRGIEPFRWKAARLGAFPSTGKATVVWAGVEDPGGLAQLAAALDRELVEVGFAREARRFTPHITLARLREPREVGDVLLPLSEQVFSTSRCESVQLFESVMKSDSSGYSEVARRPLEGAESRVSRQSQDVQPASFDTTSGTDDGWDRHS